MDWSQTRVVNTLDFAADGRHVGDLRLRHSDNANPLGYYPIPAAVLKNGAGPTLLLTGGVHGDEYEGPAALCRLIHALDVDNLRGRLIVLPALNAPAVRAASRCSPLDGRNLNRAFPGDPDGGPTAMIAHLLERVILPHCDAAVDLHAGGKASVFAPLAMFNPSPGELGGSNQRLAEAFGCPLLWLMGATSDDRSLNAAAQRQGVAMFAVELGGGGRADPALVTLAEQGVCRVMAELDMWRRPAALPAAPAPRYVEVRDQTGGVFAPVGGLFVAAVEPGRQIEAGRPAGVIYSLDEPERPPRTVAFGAAGVVVSLSHRGLVRRGDFLAQVAALRTRYRAAT